MPTIEQLTALIFAVGTMANGIGIILTYFQSRKNGVMLEVVHKSTNGINAALVASTAKASLSEGEAKGRADEKQERADRDK